jgi:hypothetical protein
MTTMFLTILLAFGWGTESPVSPAVGWGTEAPRGAAAVGAERRLDRGRRRSRLTP